LAAQFSSDLDRDTNEDATRGCVRCLTAAAKITTATAVLPGLTESVANDAGRGWWYSLEIRPLARWPDRRHNCTMSSKRLPRPRDPAQLVPVTFTVEFSEHLPAGEVSNLIGILGFKGVVRSQTANGAVLEISRPGRIANVARTLRNWDRLGWLKWSADHEISN
jgi:hypothetical protein